MITRTRIAVSLPPALVEAVNVLATAEGVTRSEYIRRLLIEHVNAKAKDYQPTTGVDVILRAHHQ